MRPYTITSQAVLVRTFTYVLLRRQVRVALLLALLYALGQPFAPTTMAAGKTETTPDAPAATFTVNTLADPGDGACDESECTLREAIVAANAGPDFDTIQFAEPISGAITLDGTQLPPVVTDLLILGPGSDQLAISGDNRSRVLEIGVTGGDAYSVTIRGVTIRDGDAPGVIQISTGAGICVYEGNRLLLEESVLHSHRSSGFGAAITNSGWLTIRNSTVAGSRSDLGGGAISNGGHLFLEGSTLSGNYSRGNGAAIRNVGALTVTNSTISGNESTLNGGGIYNSGRLYIANSTLAFNRADEDGNESGEGGGIYQSGDTTQATLGNTILAHNLRGDATPDNLAQLAERPGTVTSLGFNLSDSAPAPLNAAHDITNRHARLGPLQINGGATAGHALLAYSPALDAGLDFGASGQDQAGRARPLDLPELANPSGGDGSDIGALEAQSLPVSDWPGAYLPVISKE